MNAAILLFSPNAERLCAWQDALQGIGTATAASAPGELRERLTQFSPDLLLLDTEQQDFAMPDDVADLVRLSRSTRVIALNERVDDELELELFKLGVRGCCSNDIDPQRLKSVVIAIMQGEVWIRRSLTPRLLDAFGARRHDASDNRRANVARLSDLTRREREIAELIGNGESNKQIARQLAITERTVKAHLTEIFRKLGIADRVKLALLVTDVTLS